MREPVRDRERLEHIKDAIERIQDNIKTVSLDNLSNNVLAYTTCRAAACRARPSAASISVTGK